MNQIRISYRGPLCGEICSPPDKSISHRAIIISSLATGESVIKNFLEAEDTMRTLEAFRQMGLKTEVRSKKLEVRSERTKDSSQGMIANEVIINGNGLYGLSKPQQDIYCGNSGTTMRLMCGVLSGQTFPVALTGDPSLNRRPMKRVMKPLIEMGANIESEIGGFPPLRIKGGSLNSIDYKSPIASAQVKSAIMLAALYCKGTTTVTEPDKSRDHTERMLRASGGNIVIKGNSVSITGMTALNPLDITVPGDLSSAAFFMVAALIVPGSDITIRNTGINPTRTGIIDILKKMGGNIQIENEREVSGEPVADIHVKHSRLTGINIGEDLVLKAIDEFPVLCVAASKAEGRTVITGAGELRVKESDRIASMSSELRKMGLELEELEDGIIINGRDKLNPAQIQCYGDHRIAMSMAIAGLTADGETTISDTDCVNTSFPGFMEMLKGLESLR